MFVLFCLIDLVGCEDVVGLFCVLFSDKEEVDSWMFGRLVLCWVGCGFVFLVWLWSIFLFGGGGCMCVYWWGF